MKEIKLSTPIEKLFLKLGFAKLENFGRDYYVSKNDGEICRPVSHNRLKVYRGGTGRNGYKTVNLKLKNGEFKTHYVHQLVGGLIQHEANKNILHHKTFNKLKNGIDDLEWLTRAEHKKIHQIHDEKRKE